MSETFVPVEGEEIVTSGDRSLTLTNRRIRYDDGRRLVSITLDAVSSCGVVSRKYPVLLALALVAAAWGLSEVRWDWAARGAFALAIQNGRPGLIVAAVLLVAYFATRSAVVEIASNGGSAITLPVGSMKWKTLTNFVDDVEREKLKMACRG